MKTKHILSYFSLLLIAIACQKGEGETVETANILRKPISPTLSAAMGSQALMNTA